MAVEVNLDDVQLQVSDDVGGSFLQGALPDQLPKDPPFKTA